MANAIDFIVRAQNQASKVLKEVNYDLGQLVTTTNGLMSLGAAAGAIFGTKEMLEAGYAAMVAGAGYDRLFDSFSTVMGQIGEDADSVLAKLKTASRGMMAEQELMVTANKSVLLGVVKNSDEMAGLLTIASLRGRAFGLSTAQAFDDIVTGIGRTSPRILDNIGIMAYGEKTFEAYARSIGKATDELTDAEKKAALLQLALADLTKFSKDGLLPKDKMGEIESVAASWDNLTAAIGRYFNGPAGQGGGPFSDISGALGWAKQFPEAALDDQYRKYIAGLASEWQNQDQKYDSAMSKFLTSKGKDAAVVKELAAAASEKSRLADLISEAMSKMADPKYNNYMGLQTVVDDALAEKKAADDAAAAELERAKAEEAAAVAAQDLAAKNAALQTAYGPLAGLAREAGMEVKGYTEMVTGAIAETQKLFGLIYGAYNSGRSQLISQGQQLVQYVGAEEATRITEEALATYDSIAKEIGQDGELSLSQVMGLEEAKLKAGAYGDSLIEAARQGTKEFASWDDVVESVANQIDNLKSRIRGVLDEATTVSPVGVDPNDPELLAKLGLPREDAIQENAFRLADIMMKGFQGQEWLDEFKSEVPDIYQALVESGDPQAAAAQMLREFELGLRPELLDKEKAKERVLAFFAADQKMNSLVDDITSELMADVGIGGPTITREMVEKALGIETDGMSKEDINNSVQEAFTTSLAGLYGTGQEGASQFARGMTDNLNKGTGGEIVAKIDGALKDKDNQDALYAVGQAVGGVWGLGFMNAVGKNVPPELINLLAALVTPIVSGNLRQQDGSTNPDGG